MQGNTYKTPLKEYLYDGEYFLWVGKRKRMEIEYKLPFSTFWLTFSIIFVIIVIVSIIEGKFYFESLIVIPIVGISIFVIKALFKTDDEYYAVTNIRVMRLKGKHFAFEHLNNVSDVKIYPIDDYYNGKYAGVRLLFRGRINSFNWNLNRKGERHFNRLEKAEAENVKQLIISQRDKLNNK